MAEVTLKTRVWAKIRNHPGITLNNLYLMLPNEIPSSIRRAIREWEKYDVVHSNNLRPKQYFTDYEQYTSVLSVEDKAKRELKKMESTQVQMEIKDTKVNTAPVITQPKPVNPIEQLMDTLTLRQGMELYKELHTMFGAR